MDEEQEKLIHARMFLSHQIKSVQVRSDEKLPIPQKIETITPTTSKFDKSIINFRSIYTTDPKNSLSGSFVSIKTTGSGGKEFLTTSTSGSHNGSLILHDSESDNGDNSSDASGAEKHNISSRVRSMTYSEDEESKDTIVRTKSVTSYGLVRNTILKTPEKFIKPRNSFESPYSFSPLIYEASPDITTDKNPISKFNLVLNETIFTQHLITFCRTYQTINFRTFIQDLLKYISCDRSKSMEKTSGMTNVKEAFYSYYFQNSDLETLFNVFTQFFQDINKEPSKFRAEIDSELKNITSKFTKVKEAKGKSITIEEKEILNLLKHLQKIQSHGPEISSNSVKGAIHYFKVILKKFPSHERAFSVKDREIVIDQITPLKLLEKSLESSTPFKEVLIYTYDLYINQMDLMMYFVCKFFPAIPLGVSKSEAKMFNENYEKVKLRILKILQFWIEERPLDFIMNRSLVIFLNEFITFITKWQDCNTEIIKISKVLHTHYKDVASKIIKNHDKAPSAPEDPEENHKKDFQRASTALASPFSRMKSHYDLRQSLESFRGVEDFNFDKFIKEDNHSIAKQLTLIDWKRFKKIDLNEIITKKWLERDKSGCPYYYKFFRRFNNFSRWIKLVLLSEMNSARRNDLADKFLDIAYICTTEYQNFCSSHYIMLALCEEISYLTIKPENRKKFEDTKSIFYDQKNFLKNYETFLKQADPPMIPNHEYFFKKFLKLLDVQQLSKSPEHIKFHNIIRILELCRELKKFQHIHYNSKFKKDENLYHFLKHDYKLKFPKIDYDNEEQIIKECLQLRDVIKHQKNKM